MPDKNWFIDIREIKKVAHTYSLYVSPTYIQTQTSIF